MRILPINHYLPTCRGLLRNMLAGEAIVPFYASFKVTSRCHFGCAFCNVRAQQVPDLSTDDIRRILDNLSRSPVLMASFEGGEPLLREDIGDVLEYARGRCKFYLLFTTSVKNPFDYPIEEYARLIDFLHVSIDEGHDNLGLFDMLPKLAGLPTRLSVQTVVTADTIDKLEGKVRRCHEVGAGIVVIPATHMDKTENFFPDIDRFEATVRVLKKRYPATIHTPIKYFDAFRKVTLC